MNLTILLVFFVVTATLGIALLTLVFKGKKRPMLLAVAHGIFAVSSFALLTYHAGISFFNAGTRHTPYTSWFFFFIAILGGLYMFVNDKVLKNDLKKWIPFIHGGAALAGILSLIGFMINNR